MTTTTTPVKRITLRYRDSSQLWHRDNCDETAVTAVLACGPMRVFITSILAFAFITACGDNHNGNTPPIVGDLNLTTDEDQSLTRSIDVTDAEHDTITVTLGAPAHGTVSMASGSFAYTPEPNFHGTDMFVVTASDGTLEDTAVVTITVVSVNDPPLGVADSFATNEDNAHTAQVMQLLANDSDIDGDTLTITSVGLASNGTVVKSGNNITFTPTLNFNGNGAYHYTLSDGTASVDVTVSISVGAANDAPVAVDDSRSTPEDQALVVTSASLVTNDTDAEGQTLSVTSVSPGTGGTVALASGMVTFTPTANFNGNATFDYVVSDGAATDTGTVTVNVTPVNDNPVANADVQLTPEDTVLVVTQAMMTGNDTDVDTGTTLSVTEASNPTNGTIAFNNTNGSVTFTPTANLNGAGSFDYTLSDGAGGTATGTVTIMIPAVDDPPVATDDMAMTNEDAVLIISAGPLVMNDVDVDGDSLNIMSVGNASDGATVSISNGNITYTPAANFFGTATFDYVVTDGSPPNDTGTVVVMVLPVNDAPVANNDLAATSFGTPVNIPTADLVSNDTDVDPGTTLTVMSVSSGTGGTPMLNGANVTFVPAPGFSGNASFDYVVTDGMATATGTVTVAVAPGDAKDILSFEFRASDNTGNLTVDVPANITGTNITAAVPFGTDVTDLVARFVTTGASVTVGGATQTSGMTSNDFTSPVVYHVIAADASTQDYTVTITIAPNNAKDLTAFSFQAANNPTLGGLNVPGTITGTNIAATVPFGTNVTALAATFTTTGDVVRVGATPQTSGSTANNFTSPVTYTVVAQDLSTQDYTVTVTIAPNPAKDITAFSFDPAENPGLPMAVNASIVGQNITATIPFGPNPTMLVARFTTTGASVTVGATTQTSGTTANNFTSPVVYTVHAQDTTTQDYTVTLTFGCEGLANPTNGSVVVSNGGNAPSTATYSCDRGYALTGNATRMCTVNTYNGTAPTCDRTFMVVRTGDGNAAVDGTAVATAIEERRTTDGSVIRQIPLPTTTTGANSLITMSKTANTEGQLALSTDGRYVTFAGYAGAVGTTGISATPNSSATPATQVKRVVARIDSDGNFDTSTLLSDAFHAVSPRGAATVDGTGFWVAGAQGSAPGPGGMHFVALGSTGATTRVTADATFNYVHIAFGQLWTDNTAGIQAVGTGLPTTSGQTLTQLFMSTNTSNRAFVLLDRNPLVAGMDTAYIAISANGAASTVNIHKWTFNGTAWTQVAFTPTFTSTISAICLAAIPEGANLRLIVTQNLAAGFGNQLFSILDDGVNTAPVATSIATAPTNFGFRGVAPSPTAAP